LAGGYTQARFTEMLEAWWIGDNTTEGILKGHLNNLAVSAVGGTASPVTIATGAAMVKGFFYVNDAAGTKNIPTPAAATRVDRIVLRADYGSQVVRFQRVAGTEGAGTPALTQVANTTWEIPLAAVTVTTGGVVTVTNQRSFLNPSIQVDTDMIKADAVTTALIPNRTRKVFVPASAGENSASEIRPPSGSGVYLKEAAGTGGDRRAGGWGVVPNDYVSGFKAWAVLYSSGAAAGSVYVPFNVSYLPTSTSAWTAGTNATVTTRDVNGVGGLTSGTVDLNGVTAGDVFKCYLQRDSDNANDTCVTDLYCPGFVLSYTADS